MANPKDAKGGAKKSSGFKKKEGRKISGLYNVSGDKAERKNRFCPKCGPGYFMGRHADRVVCGKCRYVEYVKKN